MSPETGPRKCKLGEPPSSGNPLSSGNRNGNGSSEDQGGYSSQERVLEKRELYKERTSEMCRVFINPHACEETIQCQREKKKRQKDKREYYQRFIEGQK